MKILLERVVIGSTSNESSYPERDGRHFSDAALPVDQINQADTLTTIAITRYSELDQLRQNSPPTPYRLWIKETADRFEPLVWVIMLGHLLIDAPPARIAVTAQPDEDHITQPIRDLLTAFRASRAGYRLISCPTCARCQINLPDLAQTVQMELDKIPPKDRLISVAVMGCKVNGPGEAKNADVGIAWGGRSGQLFRQGNVIYTTKSTAELVKKLIHEITQI